MRTKKWNPLFPIFFVILISLACVGIEPITIDDIPAFPNATTIQSGEYDLADLLVESIEESVVGEENVDADVRLYRIPEGTSWEDVQRFYTNQLDENWELQSDLTIDSGTLKTIGWSRLGSNEPQTLLIGFAQDPFGKALFLMISLFTQ